MGFCSNDERWSGVVNWKEVQANELPEDVKTAMNVE